MGARVIRIFLLIEAVSSSGLKDKHSLVYLYTAESNLILEDYVYEFWAVTLLDDKQVDSYVFRTIIKTLKQNGTKENETEWTDSTEKLKYDGKILQSIYFRQMEFSGHKRSDGHVFQWRHGCVGEKISNGSVLTLNHVNEFGYDGEDLLSYNWTLKTWLASAAQGSELEKWLNHEHGHLHKALDHAFKESEKWLKIYLKNNTTKNRTAVPDVYVFVKKSQTESSRLNLTCLATGFYPKDLKMRLRRFTTSLPDHLLTSSGVRHNGDGTYQLRKSVDVQEEDTAGYDCYVEHSSLQEPIIKPWEGKHSDSSGVKGVIIGAVVVLVVAVVCGFIVYKQWEKRRKTPPPSPPSIGEGTPLRPVENGMGSTYMSQWSSGVITSSDSV
ncbi:H-2 class I histocompatibility antigen, alpha chain-like isoform X1 [Hoplias malabaricus]|uniref:H-2 class I histocompatibility antigen, alpha chain-like isoform X1 n=1 Tax=Hoplias malabaricus TaxID=27720 RepID=UPI003461987D